MLNNVAAAVCVLTHRKWQAPAFWRASDGAGVVLAIIWLLIGPFVREYCCATAPTLCGPPIPPLPSSHQLLPNKSQGGSQCYTSLVVFFFFFFSRRAVPRESRITSTNTLDTLLLNGRTWDSITADHLSLSFTHYHSQQVPALSCLLFVPAARLDSQFV